ncbi:MAG: hypothetical protein ABI232_10150 [Jatrophihabitantaceae bacterium]
MTGSMATARLLVRHRDGVAELMPVLRRVATLDAMALARLRIANGVAVVFVRLPFGVLVSRSVAHPGAETADLCVRTADLLDWFDGDDDVPIERRESDWRGSLPPTTGWQRIETVPDDVIRGLVRSGALALKDAAAREGVAGAQPRAEVADALLDSIVLSVRQNGGPGAADLTLRSLSALTRMGFLRRESAAGIDLAGRWTRIAAEYGSVLVERPGFDLGVSVGPSL